MPRDATELVAIEDALRGQWTGLRAWLDGLDDAALARPSVLEGWTVADLVAHLGRAMNALTACQPAEAGTRPLTLADYLSGYERGAADIAETTRDLAARLADDLLGGVDRLVEEAFAHLSTLRTLGADPVVVARRGPIHLSDMLLTRLVELVVHGDDLLRSTDRREDPVEPGALDVVARALLDVVVASGGWSLELADARAWVRLAAGRQAYDVDELAAAVHPVHTAGAVPDLGRLLPLVR